MKAALDTHDYNEKDLWSEDSAGIEGIDKKRLIPALVAAVKELDARVKELENN